MSTQIFADEIAALMPDPRIARLRDQQDIADLAALLAHAFGVGAMQKRIEQALSQRLKELSEPLFIREIRRKNREAS
jgi:hypothetical protein